MTVRTYLNNKSNTYTNNCFQLSTDHKKAEDQNQYIFKY